MIHYIFTHFYIITLTISYTDCSKTQNTHVGRMAKRKEGTITLAPWHFGLKIDDCFTRSESNISFTIASLLMRATRCEKRHVEKDSCRRWKKENISNICFLRKFFFILQWLLAMPSYLKVPIINCNGGNHCCHTVTP